MTENEIVTIVVESAIEVHRTLGGPGLLEAVYEEALAFELESRGLTVQRQKAVPLVYKGKRLASDLRLDLLVSSSSARRRSPTIACSRRKSSPTCGSAISGWASSSTSANAW